jgi:hypothetical protein
VLGVGGGAGVVGAQDAAAVGRAAEADDTEVGAVGVDRVRGVRV